MKYLYFTIILFVIARYSLAQNYDLRFETIDNQGITNGNFDVKIQMRGSTSFNLASSNITFNYNLDGLDSPTLLIAHNFDDDTNPFYNPMTVTEPNDGVTSINIVFPFTNSSVATDVTENPVWIDVVTIRFTIINTTEFSDLIFRNAEPSNTVVFKCEGSGGTFTTTLLSAGAWDSLNELLPVELNTFTVKTNGTSIELKWQTKTEINNFGFEIERKSSGLQNVNWEKISFVEGNGNSNSIKNYSYIDKNPSGSSKFAYRLKQIDNDGKFEYSDEVEIELIPDKFELFQNYPNPFNPVTNIKFSLPNNSKVRVDIFNIIGEHIMTLIDKDIEAGFHNISFNAANLSSGTYIYRIQAQGFSQTKKMLLIK